MNKKLIFIFLFLFGFLFFKISHASVIINEVAWMGTSASQYEEWIELKNNSTDDINLDGWKIYKSEDKLLFSLSGDIKSGEYFLICRTTSTVTNPLSGKCNLQGAFGGSGLNNTEDLLKLKDNNDIEQDFINASTGWPAGNAETKQTMQKFNSRWFSSPGTPGLENVIIEEEEEEEEQEDNSSSSSTTSTSSSSGSVSSTSSTSSTKEKEKEKIIPVFKSKILTSNLAFVGKPTEIDLEIKYGENTYAVGKYFWNFGDGFSLYKIGGFEKIHHIYYYPGEYNLSLEYYGNKNSNIVDIKDEIIIKVVPLTVSISKVGDYKDFFIELTNNADYRIDISHWILASGNKFFTIPKNTIIMAQKSIIIPGKVSNFILGDEKDLKLIMPTGEIVFNYFNKIIPNPKKINNLNKVTFSNEPLVQSKEENKEINYNEIVASPILIQEKNETKKEKEKENYLPFILLFSFLGISAILVYFIRRNVSSEGDDFRVIDE